MSQQLCLKHSRTHNIYDLDLHSYICQKCALFDHQYRHHSFIEANTLPNYAQQLINHLQHKFQQITINENQQKVIIWNQCQQLSIKILSERTALINEIYDVKIKQISKERDEKLDVMREEIRRVCEDSKTSMIGLLNEPYRKVRDAKVRVEKLYEIGQINEVCKLLHDGRLTEQIQYISKELSILSLELTHKLKQISIQTYNSPQNLQKKVSAAQQLLINDQTTSTSIFDISFESLYQKQSLCRTQHSNYSNSLCTTERPIVQNSKHINETLTSIDCKRQQQVIGSNVKKVDRKADIKHLFLKNTVKFVNMAQLGMNDREAIEAVKKCNLNSFVSKIDLSGNMLTHKFVILLKRQKLSKYLKLIIVKGIKLVDTREMKKEGIIFDGGRIQISDIILQY